MFEAKQLRGARGFKPLFSGLSCQVLPGETLYIKGPNGVGKSTLLKIFAGLMLPKEGKVLWKGEDLYQARETFLSELLYVGDKTALQEELTVIENLSFFKSLAPESTEFSLEEILEQLNLTTCAHLPVKYLSSGQKRRTALARLLIERKSLWILDEPFNALDADGIKCISGLLDSHLSQNGLIIFTSHFPIEMPNRTVTTLDMLEVQS